MDYRYRLWPVQKVIPPRKAKIFIDLQLVSIIFYFVAFELPFLQIYIIEKKNLMRRPRVRRIYRLKCLLSGFSLWPCFHPFSLPLFHCSLDFGSLVSCSLSDFIYTTRSVARRSSSWRNVWEKSTTREREREKRGKSPPIDCPKSIKYTQRGPKSQALTL